MVSTDLVTEAKVRAELKSGKTWARSRGCPRGRSSIGVESENAVATPGKAFTAPGPYCIANTPTGWPLVIRLYPSAMPTPTRSWAQTWGRMPAAAQAWIMDVVGKQLRNLTPSCFKMVAMASTIFMGCPPYLRRSCLPPTAGVLLLRPGLHQGPCGDYRRRGPWSRAA